MAAQKARPIRLEVPGYMRPRPDFRHRLRLAI